LAVTQSYPNTWQQYHMASGREGNLLFGLHMTHGVQAYQQYWKLVTDTPA